MKSVSCFATAGLCLALGGAAEAATIHALQISGTTTGCLGEGCSVFLDQTTDGAFSFDGLTFDITTDATGSASGFSLGDLFRFTGGTGNFTGTLPFNLQVAFVLPTGGTPDPLQHVATITGDLTGNGHAAWVNFDSALHVFTFADGSFSFGVLDIGTASGPHGGGISKGESAPLLGVIQFARMTVPDPDDQAPSHVSEPTSLILFGIGLLGAGWRARRPPHVSPSPVARRPSPVARRT